MTARDLVAGTLALAMDYTKTQYGVADTAIGNATNTTYALDPNGAGICTFVAPTTGRIMVAIGAEARDNSSTNYVRHSLRITDNRTGDIVVGPDAYARGTANVKAALDWQSVGSIFMLSGLIPGNEYTASIMYRVQGGSTADIDTVRLTVWPAT